MAEVVEVHAPRGRLAFAYNILTHVVPTIIDDSVHIGRRIALAYSWYLFLRRIGKAPNIPNQLSSWGLEELHAVAEALVGYATELVRHEMASLRSASAVEGPEERLINWEV
jgi:hypothetical protein